MTETPAPTRNHGMDNLRVFVVFLVVVLHAIISYMEYAPQWWYVLDPHRSIVFTYMVLLIDAPIMQIMFFLAGYFAWASLAKRGPGQFFADKIRRIGIPWVFGVLVLAPPTAYMIYYSRHSPMSLATFWRTDFWGPAYQQSVYWYLGVLLSLFAATAVLAAASRRVASWSPAVRTPRAWEGAAFVIAISVVSTLIATRYDLDFWGNNKLLVYQPVRVPNYIGYFFLGMFAHNWGWFTDTGYQPRLRLWGAAWLVSGAAYVIWRMGPQAATADIGSKAISIVLFNVFCLASLCAAIALFCRHVAGNGWFWRHQARNSYGIYYLHPLVMYPLSLLLVPLSISVFGKAAILVVVSYGVSLAASGLVLTRAPGLRRMF